MATTKDKALDNLWLAIDDYNFYSVTPPPAGKLIKSSGAMGSKNSKVEGTIVYFIPKDAKGKVIGKPVRLLYQTKTTGNHRYIPAEAVEPYYESIVKNKSYWESLGANDLVSTAEQKLGAAQVALNTGADGYSNFITQPLIYVRAKRPVSINNGINQTLNISTGERGTFQLIDIGLASMNDYMAEAIFGGNKIRFHYTSSPNNPNSIRELILKNNDFDIITPMKRNIQQSSSVDGLDLQNCEKLEETHGIYGTVGNFKGENLMKRLDPFAVQYGINAISYGVDAQPMLQISTQPNFDAVDGIDLSNSNELDTNVSKNYGIDGVPQSEFPDNTYNQLLSDASSPASTVSLSDLQAAAEQVKPYIDEMNREMDVHNKAVKEFQRQVDVHVSNHDQNDATIASNERDDALNNLKVATFRRDAAVDILNRLSTAIRSHLDYKTATKGLTEQAAVLTLPSQNITPVGPSKGLKNLIETDSTSKDSSKPNASKQDDMPPSHGSSSKPVINTSMSSGMKWGLGIGTLVFFVGGYFVIKRLRKK